MTRARRVRVTYDAARLGLAQTEADRRRHRCRGSPLLGSAFVAIIVLLALLLLMRIGQAFTNWDGADFEVYRRAAASWVSSGNPYAYAGDSGLATYRYAPWFAALWIPFGGVPREPLLIGWVIVLLGMTAAIMVSLVRQHGPVAIPLALLGGCLLVSTTAGGNIQALLVGALYFGIHRRSGPFWVGVAASIKIFPILYVIPWLRQGEWRKAAMAVGVMAALYAPLLLFRLPPAALDPGAEYWPSTWLWAGVAVAAVVAAVVVARTRYAWLAAGAATILTIPRLLAVDYSMILPAVGPSADRVGSDRVLVGRHVERVDGA